MGSAGYTGKSKSKVKCKTCKSSFFVKPVHSKIAQFCSAKCHHKMMEHRKVYQCSNCEKEFYRTPSEAKKSRTGNRFCTMTCRDSWREKWKAMPSGENHHFWKNGSGSYRKRAIRFYGSKCMNSSCVVTGAGVCIPIKMLDVDHIDGDRSNNELNNLKVLCVWCHAEKTRSAWD